MTAIPTLLLSGANNHDWERSTPFFADVLRRSGRFDVTVTEDPSSVLGNADALASYELLVSDYNGPAWSETAQTNFENAVASGTGLVIIHAADNAFRGWTEYEKMVGLLWREGTGHGQFHEFEVKIRDTEHPLTHGLHGFRVWDELYHRLVHMHDVPYHVLATAWSDPATGGTGEDEPVVVVTQYGKGRVYHHVLGHIWKGDPEQNKGCSYIALDNEGAKRVLLRGCEWAATGDVTLR